MNYGYRYFITKNGIFLKKCYTINIDLVKKIVKELQDDEPDAEFKIYKWDGDVIASLLPIMFEKGMFEEIKIE